jgi:predicted Ser/Thr protein kinase
VTTPLDIDALWAPTLAGQPWDALDPRATCRPAATLAPDLLDDVDSSPPGRAPDAGPSAEHGGGFRLGALLGEGGVARVYRARQASLHRDVAVKIVRDPSSERAFVNEARLSGALDHPNVLPVHDLVAYGDGTPALVMKWVRGRSWFERMTYARRDGTFDLIAELRTLLAVAQGVAFAHATGVLHLDLKPANVLIGDFGEVFVTDWGCAAVIDGDPRWDDQPQLPRPTQLRGPLGTPAYMPPELARGDGQAIDRRTDVYLLGATLFEVVTGDEVIWQNDIAVRNGRAMAAANVDAVLFNFSVWAWPQYARVAAQFCPQPIAMFASVNPQYPGLVGMLANAGSLAQAGYGFTKTFGDIADDTVYATLKARVMAVAAARRLRGLTYCLIGGRSLGIDTTVIDPAQWMSQFGIDVDHVDQYELVRRAEQELATGSRIDPALAYLKAHVRRIHWTAPDAAFRLTEDLLRRQLGLYYAAIDLIEEFRYDLCGIKGQRELTEHFATADVAEAFLNDPYHPDGTPKPPIVCATEADSDAALTMQIFKHILKLSKTFTITKHIWSISIATTILNT